MFKVPAVPFRLVGES